MVALDVSATRRRPISRFRRRREHQLRNDDFFNGLLAWFVLRVCRVSVLGTVLGCLSLELITGMVSIRYYSNGSIFELIPVGMLFASGHRVHTRQRCRLPCSGIRVPRITSPKHFRCDSGRLLSLLWSNIGLQCAATLNEQRLQNELAGSECPKFIDELKALSDKLGHAPKDQEELVRLLQRNMPRISRGPIHYESLGGKDFCLTFGCDTEHVMRSIAGTPSEDGR